MEMDCPNPLICLSNDLQSDDSQQMSERRRKSCSPQSDSDRQESSSRNREIPNLEELIRITPDVREDRVEDLRREIQLGTYNIKAERIAEKIIKGNPLDEII